MPGKKKPKPESTDHDVDGHSVRIVRGPDHEELWINGTRRRFFKYPDGYVLADNAYVAPRESLIDAVRGYLKQSERETPANKPAKKRGDR